MDRKIIIVKLDRVWKKEADGEDTLNGKIILKRKLRQLKIYLLTHFLPCVPHSIVKPSFGGILIL